MLYCTTYIDTFKIAILKKEIGIKVKILVEKQVGDQ